MKLKYILLLTFAFAITGFTDGISMALLPIPIFGLLFDFAIDISINATLGAGLLTLLILNGMYNPKLGPFAIIGGFLPGFNVLPFWAALVVIGILHDKAKDGGVVGTIAGAVEAYELSGGNPVATAFAVNAAMGSQQQARVSTRLSPQVVQKPTDESRPSTSVELKAPRMNINRDIVPAREANDNRPYVQKAA